jgi:hypothetical protein
MDQLEGAWKGEVRTISLSVMPGLVPGIHVFLVVSERDVDGRDIGERKRRRPSDGYARP